MNRGAGTAERSEPPRRTQRRVRTPREEDFPEDLLQPPRANGGSPGRTGGSNYKGLDSGLSKACPDTDKLNQKNYRSFRRRVELFERQCHRRSVDAAIEGTLLLISRLQDLAWDSTEQISFEALERSSRPFTFVYEILDNLYQYEQQVEVPTRCEEFFAEFQRLKNEDMTSYLVRHRTLLKRMKEVGVEMPALLSGWHLLTRAGVPRWTHVQVKALCQGELEYEKVHKALMKMFGGDHRPNPKDLMKMTGSSNDVMFEDDYDIDDEEGFYEEEDLEWWDDEIHYEEDEEWPEEMDEAADAVDEAFISYLDSRRRMRELALSRGFFPVVALGPDVEGKGGGKGKGKSSSKGKGKGKSSMKGKGKGKSGFRRTFDNRRPMSGLRRPTSSSNSSNINDIKSTLSGSTGQHGPRFKRFRVQSNGVKEVPEEQVSMVEENATVDECYFAALLPGQAIIDSGATRTIVGEDVWKEWLSFAGALDVKITEATRDFKFGGGEVLRSSYDVTFPVALQGQDLVVTASVVPGKTPLLLARPTLEEWKVQQDYEKGMLRIMNSDWFKPERGRKGHYIVNLFENNTMDETSLVEEALAIPEEIQVIMREETTCWEIEPSIHKEVEDANEWVQLDFEDKSLIHEVLTNIHSKPKMNFFEVYVDEGRLATTLVQEHEDVEVATFTLPDWDFSTIEAQESFISLLKRIRPEHVWLAPPCTKWSSMQNLNALTPEAQEKLKKERCQEEKDHLKFVVQVFDVCADAGLGVSMEHPRGAESWKTKTMSEMDMTYLMDAECDRCQTGLCVKLSNGMIGKVKKPTRIRTNSPLVYDALNLTCNCAPGEHVKMEGRSRELKHLQNYERGFVQRATEAIYRDMCKRWHDNEMLKIFVTDELDELEVRKEKEEEKNVQKEDKELMRTHGRKAWQIVNKLHRQLGHPGREKLIHALKGAKFPEEVIQCARKFTCEICQSEAPKKLAHPASLDEASYFNEVIEMDTFHLKWGDEKVKILAIIDLFTKYEVNAVLPRETEAAELKIIEDLWFHPFGFPIKLKTDASGAHMSQNFIDAMDGYKIKLVLIPKEAHYRLGTIERLHAVRRLQLLKMRKEMPDIKLDTAIRVACDQRNRLRTVHGSSPAEMVFGRAPNAVSGLLDEPQDLRPELPVAVQENVTMRVAAAKAFHSANHDALLRRSLLARPRAEHEPLSLGSWVFYWRQGDQKLEPSRWRGPAILCMIEPRVTDSGACRPSVYWVAHGSSLVRVAPEHIRPELPRERLARLEHFPETALDRPVQDTIRQVLQPVRGPVHFLDLAPAEISSSSGGTSFANASSAQPEQRPPSSAVAPTADNLEDPNDEKEAKLNDLTIEEPIPSIPEEGDQNMPEEKQEAEESKEISQEPEVKQSRERSRSPPMRDEKAQAFRSYNMARQLDGMGPVAEDDPGFQRMWQSSQPMEEDEELMADTFNEKKLSAEEKKEFDLAKDKALQVWLDNAAWKAVNESEAREGEVIPARFLQRWKPTKTGKVANARVIIQGFRHKDVLTEELDRESPTLSRTGRMLILIWACQFSWKVFAADVKSAFMQSKSIDEQTRIFIRPTAEMRRRLERLMGLKPWELLKATKPAFGDVRAPRQWYESAREFLLEEAKFLVHPLDNCVFLSWRRAYSDDPEFQVFSHGGVPSIVDGILGLHVDDFLGCGEGVNSVEDATGANVTEEENFEWCFKKRLQMLSKKFRFGSWDFGRNSQILFCGTSIEQSLNNDVITLSLKEYVHKIKPITLDKSRKTMSDAPLEEKEVKMLRALIGALAWPAGQCLPQLSASISLLQASSSSPTVNDINVANKLLRFAKEVVQGYNMTLRRHGSSLAELRFGVYMDASWGIRPDGASQGGHAIFVGTEAEMTDGKPFPVTLVSWHSKKLTRMCRSSLSAEAQSAAGAIDETEWTKIYAAAMVCPTVPIAEESTLRMFGQTPALTDAKSLFDSARSVSAGLRLTEKRTAIEVCIVKERLNAMLGYLKWVNSTQQVADGLTKPSAKDQFAHILKRGVHALRYDPNFTAAKKVSKEVKADEEKEQDEAAWRLFDGEVLEVEEIPKEICQLPGCGKKLTTDQGHHRYCSRRHYYKDYHRRGLREDLWEKSARVSVALLATHALSKAGVQAMPLDFEEKNFRDERLWWTLLVVVFFSFVGLQFVTYKVYVFVTTFGQFVLRRVIPRAARNEIEIHEEPENEAEPENDDMIVRDESTQYDEVPEIDSLPRHGDLGEEELAVDERISDAGSSSVNDDPEVNEAEWIRWNQIKESVENEVNQRRWKRFLREVVGDDENMQIDSALRGVIIQENWTDTRCRTYKKLLDIEDTVNCTSDQIRLWNRLYNDRLLFMIETDMLVKKQREEIESLERSCRKDFWTMKFRTSRSKPR